MTAIFSDRELLARLIAFDTTSNRSNLPLVDFVAAYLDAPGVGITRHFSPDQSKAALVVHLGPPVDPHTRAGLVLCGHTDVVPAAEPEWMSEPFELVERDQHLIGRGACDMKGFLSIAVNAAKRIRGTELACPLVLLFTYDEELNTRGAREFVRSWPGDRVLPRDVLVGEPTECDVVHMHKGMLELAIEVTGIPAHSGYPHFGRNAIEPAARIVTALARLRRTLEAERVNSAAAFPEVPYAALNVGTIHGGVAVNIVPDRCAIGVTIRMLPGMVKDDVVARVTDTVAAEITDEPHSVAIVSESPPMRSEATDPLVVDLLRLAGESEPHTVSYATDAGWLQTAGYRCAIFGPGSIAMAHKPNESLPLDQFAAAASVVKRLIAHRCGVG